MNCALGTTFVMIFLSILIGPAMNAHRTAVRDPREKPRRLLPSRTVLPLRRLSRLLGRHHPTNMVEFESMDMVMSPLLNIPWLTFFVLWPCLVLYSCEF